MVRNPMIQNINLLIQKQANMMLLGVIEVFKDFQQLCNLFESHLILSHTMQRMTFAKTSLPKTYFMD